MFFSRFVLFAGLAAPALASIGTPTLPRLGARSSSLNPADVVTKTIAVRSASDPMTNAERFARGLPPMRPRHKGRRALAPRQSAAPPACPATTGLIAVAGDGLADGYVSRIPNAFGEYGYTANVADALQVSLPACNEGTGEPFNILALNGIADFPYFGGVTGFENDPEERNLAAGSFNYVYLAGTPEVPENSPAVAAPNSFTEATSIDEEVESAIWTLANANDVLTLTARWVNVDGGVPAVELVYDADDQVILIIGDRAAFEAEYGPSQPVTLTFVPQA